MTAYYSKEKPDIIGITQLWTSDELTDCELNFEG